MTLKNILAAGLIAGCMTAGVTLFSPAPALAQQAAIKALDTDKDGTLDLEEVTKAAQAVFDNLQKDQDDTLDRKEVGSRLTAKEFAGAIPTKTPRSPKKSTWRSLQSCSSRPTWTATASSKRKNSIRKQEARFCA